MHNIIFYAFDQQTYPLDATTQPALRDNVNVPCLGRFVFCACWCLDDQVSALIASKIKREATAILFDELSNVCTLICVDAARAYNLQHINMWLENSAYSKQLTQSVKMLILKSFLLLLT